VVGVSAVSEKTSTVARVRARVDALRRQIADLSRERAEIEAAPPPPEERRAALEACIAAIGARWRPTVDPLSGHIGELAAPDLVAGISTESALEGLLARLLGPALVDLLVEEIDRAPEGRAPGLPSAARPAKLAELEARIFALECEEERLIEEAEAAGITIERRADADPCAVLGLEVPPRAA